jgi:hypothetical protein
VQAVTLDQSLEEHRGSSIDRGSRVPAPFTLRVLRGDLPSSPCGYFARTFTLRALRGGGPVPPLRFGKSVACP